MPAIFFQPAVTIAIIGLGPAAQPLLAPLRDNTPPGVLLLQADTLPTGQALAPIGLLILVAQQATDADSQAMLALAQQVQDCGFGLPALCVVVPPPSGTPDKQKTLAHYALQALQAHTDAHVLLPGDADIAVPAWLAQAVTDMAQSLGHSASIGIDIEDLTRLLRNAGPAAWVSVQASGPEKAPKAVQKLLAHPFLAELAPQSARQAAVSISAAPQAFKLSELRDIGRALQQHLHPDATQLYSVLHDERLGDAVRISALFTGITHSAP